MLALCMTVKNEVKLLAHNLRYHRAAGVEEFLIYDDGSTDGTPESIMDIPGVHVSPSVDPAGFMDHPQLGWIAKRAGELITARQSLNAYVAFSRAREAGHDWVISLDADELLFPMENPGVEGSLTRYFTGVPADVEAVVFKPAELVPTRMDSEHPFMDCQHFRRKSLKDTRAVGNPYTGEEMRIGGFIGHKRGKSAARPRADIVHDSVHRFVSMERGVLRQQTARWLLHYNIQSFGNFVEKYQRFEGLPETWLNGAPIEQPRALWIRMIHDPAVTEAELREYYQKHLLETEEALENDGDVRRITKVARFFAREAACDEPSFR